MGKRVTDGRGLLAVGDDDDKNSRGVGGVIESLTGNSIMLPITSQRAVPPSGWYSVAVILETALRGVVYQRPFLQWWLKSIRVSLVVAGLSCFCSAYRALNDWRVVDWKDRIEDERSRSVPSSNGAGAISL